MPRTVTSARPLICSRRTDLTRELKQAFLAFYTSIKGGYQRIASVEDDEAAKADLRENDFVDAREYLTGLSSRLCEG